MWSANYPPHMNLHFGEELLIIIWVVFLADVTRALIG